MTNVLILGGGFGGVAAAVTLQEQLGAEVQITLVSKKPFFHGRLSQILGDAGNGAAGGWAAFFGYVGKTGH